MSRSSENARLEALHARALLDTAPSEPFDRITRMTVQLFDLPSAAISLTDRDRQWFKSRVGVDRAAMPREGAPCAAVTASGRRLVIPDLLDDAEYGGSPLAGLGVRFYAGAPLTARDGHCLGAICVMGPAPRRASDRELAGLADLAAMAVDEIEARHPVRHLDPATLIPNRTQLALDLAEQGRIARRHGRWAAVLVDLAAPEPAGAVPAEDAARRAAAIIRVGIGDDPPLYRVGPTRFLFLEAPGIGEAAGDARLEDRVGRLGGMLGPALGGGVTLGVASFVPGRATVADILEAASDAAGTARAAGQAIGRRPLAGDAAHRRRFRLLDDFPAALEARDQLRLVYQPRIDLASGACVGAEALLRWRHPTLGHVPPGDFIPLLEQTPLIRPALDWVLESALARLARWRARRIDMAVSVNVSAANLSEPDLPDRIAACLDRHGLQAGTLELEVTESAMMRDPERAVLMLDALSRAGIRLAIDDFGTGYSSLSYLARLPVHVVKIDRSFLRDIGPDRRRRVLFLAMVALSHELGHRVVAEGVETPQEHDIVRGAGCDEAQGYLLGRPLEADDVSAWWHAHRLPPGAREAVLAARPPRDALPH